MTDEEIYKYKVLDDISITCQAFGQPVPNVTWYQNDTYVTSGIGKRKHGSNPIYRLDSEKLSFFKIKLSFLRIITKMINRMNSWICNEFTLYDFKNFPRQWPFRESFIGLIRR